MRKTLRVFGTVLLVLVGLGGLGPPAAEAIQASGSIILSPAKQLQLVKGETVDVTVSVVNTSSQTPLPPGPAAPATLTGPITVELGCTDCACSQQSAGSLVFVPGPNAGCVTKAGGVLSCAAGGGSSVVIELSGAGVALPADNTPVAIATIQVRMNVDTGPPLGIRAGTGVCAITACINPPDQGCVSCSAEGCTFLTPNANVSPPCDCPHLCANKIRFAAAPDRPDFFELHAIIQPGAGFDPVANPFTVTLSNSGGQFVNFTLPAGSLSQQGENFQFSDNGAATAGGISRVRLSARDDAPGAFRIDIQGYAFGIEEATTVPVDDGNIAATWDVGGQTWSSGSMPWERKNFGWQLNQFGLCPGVNR
jgi:hypothetical protein